MNGSSGIAVGMATNMMPHNLSEVIDGCIAYIDKKDITIEELIQYVKAPDFPTGVSSMEWKASKPPCISAGGASSFAESCVWTPRPAAVSRSLSPKCLTR